MKVCTKCGAEKAPERYSPDKRASDGLQSACRECSREAHRKRYQADPKAAAARRRDYYRRNTEVVKAANERYRTENRERVLQGKRDHYQEIKDTPDYLESSRAYREATKEQKAEYDKAYALQNSRKKVAAAQRWARENPTRRAAIVRAYDGRRRANKGGGATGPEVAAWTAAQPKVCHWCGDACADSFHVDHYHPLSKGGAHDVENFVIACSGCNLKKNAKDPHEFAQSMGRLL